MTLRQIVEDNDLMSALKKFFNADTSDISSSACNENLHKLEPVFDFLFNVFNHLSDRSNSSPRPQNLEAYNVGAFFQYLDVDSAHTPLVHKSTRGHVEIDRFGPNQSRTVVVYHVNLVAFDDPEFCSNRKTRPIRCGTVDPSACEMGTDRIPCSVFRVSIGGCSNAFPLADFAVRETGCVVLLVFCATPAKESQPKCQESKGFGH